MLKVVLFLGSVREGRLGLRVANFMKKQLEDTNHEVIVFDPKEMQFPLLDKPIFFHKDKSVLPEWMVKAEKQVKEADAFVIVSAEYNHSIPPALSNMMDYFGASCYSYKPSGIVCYSAEMTASMHGRPLNGEVKTIPSGYTGIVLHEARKVATEDQDRQLDIKSKFNEFTYWNLDKVATSEDKLLKALQWIEVASILHNPIDGEQSSQTSVTGK